MEKVLEILDQMAELSFKDAVALSDRLNITVTHLAESVFSEVLGGAREAIVKPLSDDSRKIQAIKLIREYAETGLKEAKEMSELDRMLPVIGWSDRKMIDFRDDMLRIANYEVTYVK